MRSKVAAIRAGSLAVMMIPLCAAATDVSPSPLPATCSFGFDNVAQLSSTGWVLVNNSDPLGTTGWFQGKPSNFPAQAGATNSYASADFNNTSGAFSVISNWLITPDIQFTPTATLTFYTRELSGANDAPNHLVVLVCEDGNGFDCTNPGTQSGDIGGFQTQIAEINPDATAGGYPASWTPVSAAAAQGMPQSGSGRIAFRYYDFAQGAGVIGTAIGIDTLGFSGLTVCPLTDIVFQDGFE
jgi:hypothetical protein